jgi:hypothetical protein
MMVPTVHRNGTTSEILLDQYTVAAQAVQTAIAAVCDAGPNSRDYYVQGSDAALAAQREHEARVKALKTVRDELAAIVERIQDQLDTRDAAQRSR